MTAKPISLGVSPQTVALLAGPTPAAEIRHRQGPKGKTLSYVDARYVMDVLDRIVGPGNWQRRQAPGFDRTMTCEVGILIDGEWVFKADGAGESDIEGEKGAYSDSFKRAAVNWGIGRDLYGSKAEDEPVAPKPQRDLREKIRAVEGTVSDSLKIKIRATARERGLGDAQLKLLSIHLVGKDSSKDWTLSDADLILATLEDPDKAGTIGMFAEATPGWPPQDS